jgi:acyl homoserine lactone synthase
MITIGGRNELAAHIVSSMHEFRHEVFIRRLGWSLPLLEGIERDRYDNEQAVYFVVRDEDGNITACARLLPTTASYMLPDLFTELLGGQPAPRDPAVWELSRFATSVRNTREGRILSLSQPTLDLLEAVIEFARQRSVKRLLLVTSIAIERLLLRAAFDVHRLAAPVRMSDGLFAALFMEISAAPATGDRGCTRHPGDPRAEVVREPRRSRPEEARVIGEATIK